MSTTAHTGSAPADTSPTSPHGGAAVPPHRCGPASADPTGALAAFVCDRGGTPQLWLAAHGDAEPRLLDERADPVTDVSWSPDGRWIAYTSAPGGGEHTVVRCVRPDGSGHRVLAGAGSPAAASFGCWTPDGTALAVTEAVAADGDAPAPGPADAHTAAARSATAEMGLLIASLVDPDGRAAPRRVAAETGSATLRVCDVSRDGRWILLRRGPRGHREAVVLDTVSGRETCLLPAADGDPRVGRFSPDARTLWLRSDEDREYAALLAVELTADGAPGRTVEAAARPDADLELFSADRAVERAALVWNRDGRSLLETAVPGADGTLGAVREVRLPHEVVTRAEPATTGGLLLSLSSSVRPPGVWVAAPDGDPVRTAWTWHRSRPAPASSAPRPPLLLELTARDGLPLSGWFHRAPGVPDAGPCVVHLHGGPESQERPVLDPLYQALLARGLHVFAPDVRGSSGHGRAFLAADLGAGRFAAIDDVADCAAHLVAAGLADPDRLAVMGRSYGGYLVMSVLVRHPDLFRAGVAVSGISDFATFFSDTEPWNAESAAVKYGHPVHDHALLALLSPMTHIGALRAPLLAVHGALDTNVPPGESERFVRAARRLGATAELLVFPDEGHDLARRANRERLYAAAGQWLTRWTT
ncbi:S9 family peptidase [Actinacidiphila paucisporea]|uniref:Dipeptidyl aminopeptidase/acylaminoacyl peptidase n=1 Tax=Actinacidiphila paucisporea TaxID=310782 RepID=A0A1M7M399_9ACTN|nr:alpha/beta fold hydrolase [Actinacidiphila paucisporea]SHM85153.1 Dipeptidyl aminopeptidase/acylaminoacyl peptidase [Actinacidiphila paucisporea]